MAPIEAHSTRELDTRTLAVMALKVISLLVGLATTVVLARWLGPASFGIYSFVLAVAAVAVLPAHAGLSTLLERETARGYAVENWGGVRGLWRWAFRLTAILTSLIAVLLLATLWTFQKELAPAEFNAAFWSILLIPVLGANSLRGAAMRGIGEPVKGIVLEALVKPGVLLTGVVVLYSISILSPGTAVAANLVATMTAVFLGLIWFRRLRGPQVVNARPAYKALLWWQSIAPLAFLVGTQQLIKYTDIILLGALTTATDVGQYRIATQASELIIFALVGVRVVASPRIARLYTLGEKQSMQRLVIRASQWSVSAALFAFLVLTIWGESLLRIVFGPDYVVSIQPLITLALGQLFVAYFGLASTLLTMTGYERISLRIFVFASILNLALNLLLIPLFDMLGAAIATATSLAVAHVSLSRAVAKCHGLQTTPFFTSQDSESKNG